MTADLVAFLRARLDEDGRLARAVEEAVGTHRAGENFDDGSGPADNDAFPSYPWGHDFDGHELRFMAGPGHPSRVLADIAAKHALLDMHTPVPTARALAEGRPYRSCSTCDPYPPMDAPSPGSCPTLRLLVRPYAGHPHFHPSWSTE